LQRPEESGRDSRPTRCRGPRKLAEFPLALFLNVLPSSIARFKPDESPLTDYHPEATVLFADIVGFTPLAKSMPTPQSVEILPAEALRN